MQREGKQLTWRRKSAVLGGKKYVGNFTIYVKHVFCPCQIKGLFVFVKAASEELLAAEAVEQGQYQRYKLYVDTMNKKVDFPVSHNYHETILASRQIHRKMAASPLHWRSHQHTCPAVGQLWLKHKGATRSS